MQKHHLRVLVPGILVAATLALAVGVGAQTPASPAPHKSPQAAPMAGHHKGGAAAASHDADMKMECQAMMAKKQEMQAKAQAMDAALDKLVADMNAAQGSDAREKAMAAVVTELVAQRKASHSMTMEMQPAMMAHMMHHMEMHGTKGAMECPMMQMMKTGKAAEPKADEKTPKM